MPTSIVQSNWLRRDVRGKNPWQVRAAGQSEMAAVPHPAILASDVIFEHRDEPGIFAPRIVGVCREAVGCDEAPESALGEVELIGGNRQIKIASTGLIVRRCSRLRLLPDGRAFALNPQSK